MSEKQGKTLADLVEIGIKQIFREIAAMENDLSADDAAGLPLTLFQAETTLLTAWRRFTGEQLELQ